jgi:hypothetical protein
MASTNRTLAVLVVLLSLVPLHSSFAQNPTEDQYIRNLQGLTNDVIRAGSQWRLAIRLDRIQHHRESTEAQYRNGHLPDSVKQDGYRKQDNLAASEQHFKDLRRDIDALRTEIFNRFGDRPPDGVAQNMKLTDDTYEEQYGQVIKALSER